MERLVVEREVAIAAPVEVVWSVLTEPRHTRAWAGAFGASGPLEAEWRLGGPVRWRNARGEIYVSGRVVAFDPPRLLCFSVRDVDPRMQPASGEEADDILQRYELSEVAGGTRLRTAHGDFAKLAGGAEIHARVGSIWERLLARLKELAER